MRNPNDFRLVLCILFRGTDYKGVVYCIPWWWRRPTDRPEPARGDQSHVYTKEEIQTYIKKYNNKIINTYLYNGRFTGARRVL